MNIRTTVAWGMILALFLSMFALPACAQEDANLHIRITRVPVYGKTEPSLTGDVYADGGASVDLTQYFIAYYVGVDNSSWIRGYYEQYSEGGEARYRFHALSSDGKFESAECPQASGGIAHTITALLIDMQDGDKLGMCDLAGAKELALCYTTIGRTLTDITITDSANGSVITDTPADGIYVASEEEPDPDPDPDPETPRITVSYVPPYGTSKTLTGCVTGDFDAADYCLSCALQLQPGGEVYRKPLDTRPYETICASGAFSYWFASGEGDENARVLTLYLIPTEYVNTFKDEGSYRGFDPASVAVDTVVIERDPDSGTTLPSDRYVAEPNTKRADIPITEDKLAVNVGFYTEEGTQPGDELSEEHVNEVLDTAKSVADTVRFYSASGTIEKAYAAAAAKGLRVVGMASLGPDTDENEKEMDALIRHCKNGYVSLAIVGNEVLKRGDLTRDELIKDIEYVRSAIEGTGVPVTTSDSLEYFTDGDSAELRRAVDVYAPNIYPYWVHVTDAEEAVAAFEDSVAALVRLSGDKQIVISETMMPTEDADGDYGADAAEYLDGIRAWSVENDIPVLYFELADEPFKVADEGAVGKHWGIFDNSLTLKESYKQSETIQKAREEAFEYATLPADMTTIDDEAFQNCTSVEGLYIPPTVTSISEHAFDGCENLIIVCEENSYAREYADGHGIEWRAPQ